MASARRFSIQCTGACTHTWPSSSKPFLPARPEIWANSRLPSSRVEMPSYLQSCVNSTVRMGTFTPTPRVSVPHISFSRPFWANFSMSRR